MWAAESDLMIRASMKSLRVLVALVALVTLAHADTGTKKTARGFVAPVRAGLRRVEHAANSAVRRRYERMEAAEAWDTLSTPFKAAGWSIGILAGAGIRALAGRAANSIDFTATRAQRPSTK